MDNAEEEAKKQLTNIWRGTREVRNNHEARTSKMRTFTLVAIALALAAAAVSYITETPGIIYGVIGIFVVMLGLWVLHDKKSLEHSTLIAAATDDLQSMTVQFRVPKIINKVPEKGYTTSFLNMF